MVGVEPLLYTFSFECLYYVRNEKTSLLVFTSADHMIPNSIYKYVYARTQQRTNSINVKYGLYHACIFLKSEPPSNLLDSIHTHVQS